MVRFVEHLEQRFPDARERLARLRPALVAADPATMRWLLARLLAEHGSFEGYLDSLGMAPVVPFLRANLLD
jgi:hypothetical protein